MGSNPAAGTINSSIAQLAERRTVNPQVPGSSPGRGATTGTHLNKGKRLLVVGTIGHVGSTTARLASAMGAVLQKQHISLPDTSPIKTKNKKNKALWSLPKGNLRNSSPKRIKRREDSDTR